MIVGLGTDIVEITRIADKVPQAGDHQALANCCLAQRVLTENELAIFIGSAQPGRYLAKRFAAKEAAAKALGTGIGRGVSFQHIEITNDSYGAPLIHLFGGAAERLATLGGIKGHISIADEKHYAIATVIFEN